MLPNDWQEIAQESKGLIFGSSDFLVKNSGHYDQAIYKVVITMDFLESPLTLLNFFLKLKVLKEASICEQFDRTERLGADGKFADSATR